MYNVREYGILLKNKKERDVSVIVWGRNEGSAYYEWQYRGDLEVTGIVLYLFLVVDYTNIRTY